MSCSCDSLWRSGIFGWESRLFGNFPFPFCWSVISCTVTLSKTLAVDYGSSGPQSALIISIFYFWSCSNHLLKILLGLVDYLSYFSGKKKKRKKVDHLLSCGPRGILGPNPIHFQNRWMELKCDLRVRTLPYKCHKLQTPTYGASYKLHSGAKLQLYFSNLKKTARVSSLTSI